jgi:hypothetical protein
LEIEWNMKSLFIKWMFIFGNMAAFKECAFEIRRNTNVYCLFSMD